MGNSTFYNDIDEKQITSQHRGTGKNLTYVDFDRTIANLQSKIADYEQFEANAQAIFNEFKKVAERVKSGIYRYDINSHSFLFFNQSAIKLLGSKMAEASDITSRSILFRIHPYDRQRVRQSAKESITSGIGEVEYRFRKNDGTYRWNYDRWVVLYDFAGQPRYIEGIVMDTTRRREAEEALKESQRKLRSLSSYLMEAQEKKRRRIALELHDELGQSLTVLKLKLRDIKQTIAPDSVLQQKKCEDANEYVDHIIENVRRLSHELCPSCLEDLGLDESIAMLVEEFSQHTNLEVSIEAQKMNDLFRLPERTHIYRIVQESLNNIQKHAQARNVSIKIERGKFHVDLQIGDDGKGFGKKQDCVANGYRASLGLVAMEERARMLGGKMQVYSIIGVGTRIAFTIPISVEEPGDDFLSYSFG